TPGQRTPLAVSYSAPLPRDPRPHRRILASVRSALVWAVAAAAVNLVLWLFMSVAGIPTQTWPAAGADAVDLGPLAIVGATLFAGLVAGLGAGLLGKIVRRVARWIVIAGVVVTAASLSAPWGQPEAVPTSTRVVLTLMHLVTGGLVIFGLTRGVWADDRSVVM
ncbi:MAG: DUF6069 family protein, partial [Actinomycetes bacterium]